MPDFATPWALLGLALIPAIRWLHRYRLQGPAFQVSALFLWRGLVSDDRGPVRSARPQPQWRRRAGIAALLVLALAGPRLPLEQPVTARVWWDGALSMHAVEGGRSRHALAIGRLLEAADERGVAVLHLSPLRGAGPTLTLGPGDRAGRAVAIARWLDGLPVADAAAPLPVLDPRHRHWLVSDGSAADLAAWSALQPIGRVIAVGEATENIAVTGLAVRAATRRDAAVAGMVRVHNAGRQAARVELTVSAGDGPLQQARLELPPAATTGVEFSVGGAPQGLEARVRRLDATPEPLAADDRLSLGLASFGRPRAVRVSGRCPPAIDAALAAHPGLVRADASGQAPPRLQIACTERPPPDGPPLLWLPAARPAAPPVGGDAHWLDAPPGVDVRLPLTGPVRLIADPDPGWGRVLLAVGGQPLALLQSDPRPVITLLLDPGDGSFAGSAGFPRLFAALIDRLLGEPLLAPRAAASRPEAASRIAPQGLKPAPVPAPAPPEEAPAGLAPWLLWPAALLLSWDLFRVLRRAPPLTAGAP